MKARIIKRNGFWVGEVYGDWRILILYKYTGWLEVTTDCLTYLGAKYELRKWIKEHIPKEYKL